MPIKCFCYSGGLQWYHNIICILKLSSITGHPFIYLPSILVQHLWFALLISLISVSVGFLFFWWLVEVHYRTYNTNPLYITTCAVLSHLSHVRFFVTLQIVALQAPLSIRILQIRIQKWVAIPSSRGCYWPMDHTDNLVSPALAGRLFTTSTTWEAHITIHTPTVSPSHSFLIFYHVFPWT